MGSLRGRAAQERLQTLYARTPGPVVFVDESVRAPGNSYGERPFYTMSGVTVPKDSLDIVRKELERIVGANYWHTTEAYNGKLGPVEELRPRILELNEYLARVVDFTVVTVQTEISTGDNALQKAREECITTLARAATSSRRDDPPRLMVFEQLKEDAYPGGNARDHEVFARLRNAGLLHRSVVIESISPWDEKLLWAADLSSWSFYHQLARSEGTWFKPLAPVTTVLHARTGLAVKGSNPHLPQQGPGVQPTVSAQRGGGPAVASESRLVHQGKENQVLHAVRTEADSQRPALDHSVSLGVGTNSPKSIEAIKERFDWYLNAQRSQRSNPEASEHIKQLLEQAQQALRKPQRPPEPPGPRPEITGPQR
ncbi:hypothetical protein [Arthrobacter sp. efr-133-R2A-63]|uniref:hypothetical protein n=1 Tax=Arthrobacter sp. efr-133-R2A-63 TaxID=3040278 RepID=UPI00254F9E1F|nr:hypothetical protein [Arthrobacter sp. efr-133-R2A-63]